MRVTKSILVTIFLCDFEICYRHSVYDSSVVGVVCQIIPTSTFFRRRRLGRQVYNTMMERGATNSAPLGLPPNCGTVPLKLSAGKGG